MPFVPEEIIMQEILPRLATKSLVRFSCVCKSWNSKFYNPDFLSHLNHSRSSISHDNRDDDDDYHILMNSYNSCTHYGLSILSRKQLSETRIIHNYVPYPLNLKLSWFNLHLVGSVNGLVCMASQLDDEHQFILWNPTIRFFKNISVPKHWDFNCFLSPFLYGFGWNSVTNDYKLIAKPIQAYDASPASVYSCKTDCWSNTESISCPWLDFTQFSKPPCVIINGSPYWTDDNILKFDITSNEFKYLDLPSGCTFYNLINLNDCLALIDKGYQYSDKRVLYSFDEENNIWMKMHTIVDKHMNLQNMKVYCFKSGGEILFHENQNLHLYDPKSRELIKSQSRFPNCRGCLVKSHNEIKHHGCDPSCGGSLVNGFSYTPSLLVLQGMKALYM